VLRSAHYHCLRCVKALKLRKHSERDIAVDMRITSGDLTFLRGALYSHCLVCAQVWAISHCLINQSHKEKDISYPNEIGLYS